MGKNKYLFNNDEWIFMKNIYNHNYKRHLIVPPKWGPFAMIIKENGIEMSAPSGYPTVIGNFELTTGRWYYEIELIISKCGQFGWGLHSQSNNSNKGRGTGHDSKGWAFNGYKMQKCNGETNGFIDYGKEWKANDIVGFAL